MLESLRLSVFARMNLSCESVATLCEALCFSARPAFMPFGRGISRMMKRLYCQIVKFGVSPLGERKESG
jgi:hypothetical protein